METKLSEVNLSREELFEKVWSTSITEIAKSFALRDYEIIKLCDQNNIPRPPSGYWSKIRHGYQFERPPLPTSTQASSVKIPPPRSLPPQRKVPTIKMDNSNAPIISQSSRPQHTLIEKTYKAYGATTPDDTDRLRSKENALDVYVGYRILDRALNFMDLLIKELEIKGFSIAIKMDFTKERNLTYAAINGEQTPFHLEEGLLRKKTYASRKNRTDFQRQNDILNGILTFSIDSYLHNIRPFQWTDTKTIPIEHRLSEIIDAFFLVIEKLKEIREAEEQKRKEEEDANFRKEQIAQLEPCSLTWEKANRIRSFITAFEHKAKEKFGELTPEHEITKLCKLARDHADSIDPVIQSLKALEKQC